MILEKNSRYTGILEIERNCSKVMEKNRFIIIFSFDLEDYDENDGKAVISKVNPIQIKNLLKKYKDFYIIFEKDMQVFQTKATLVSISNDQINVEINNKDTLIDQRKFQRYNFCPEDLEVIKIYQNGRLITEDGYFLELSARGIKILIPEDKTLDGKMIEVFGSNNSKFFDVKVHQITNFDKNKLIRGEILNPRINVTEYILKSYIKIYKTIIKTG